MDYTYFRKNLLVTIMESDNSDFEEIDDFIDRQQDVYNAKFVTIGGHHCSPIYDSECRLLVNTPLGKWKCKRHRKLSKHLIDSCRGEALGLLTEKTKNPRKCIKDFVRSVTVNDQPVSKLVSSLESWIIQKIWFLSPAVAGDTVTLEMVTAECARIRGQLEEKIVVLQKYYDDMVAAERMKDAICNKEIKMGSMIRYYTCELERDVTLFSCECHGRNLVPTSLVLDSLDQMQTRFSLYLYWLLSDITGKYTESITERGHSLIVYFEGLLDLMGNDFFTVMNIWESLYLGYVILDERDVGFEDLYMTQCSDMLEIFSKYNLPIDFKLMLPTTRKDEEVYMCGELLGIMKHFGYPVLEVDKLLNPLKEFGTEEIIPIDRNIVDQVMGVTIRNFCINYWKKNKTYPKIVTSPPELVDILSQNKPIPPGLHRRYDLWEQVIFGKTFEYDYTPDMVELLKDSACANPLSAWGKGYDRCGFNILYGKEPPPSTYTSPNPITRVVLAYLKSHPDALREYVTQIEQGLYDEDHHVAVIAGKECELKAETGRGFTIQTFMQRMLQSSNEFNTSKKVFPYVPEQSMTDTEVTETRRLLAQIKGLQSDCELFVLDLKKWCLFWRWESVIKLGRMYDQLFGFKRVFTNAHTYFINRNIFSNQRLFPPDYDQEGKPIPGPFFLNDFVGGMEGMHQKRWTHLTEGALELAAEMTGVEIQIIGQGDNQIVILKYKPGQDRNQVRKAFRDNLVLVLQGLGHKLKEKETWISNQTHEYGKLRVYRGRHISQGTKRACKLMPDSNDVLHSIPLRISTLNTMTEGMARLDYDGDIAFMMNNMLVFHYLHRSGLIKNNDSQISKMSALLYPVDFGGLPLSNYNNHLVRGHPDQVTIWLGVLMVIRSRDPDTFRYLRQVWQLIEDRPLTDEKFLRLIEDIYALRVSTLPSIEQAIREDSMEFLNSDYVTNPAVTQLREGNNMVTTDEIVTILRQMNPFFAQMAHVIYANSNVGLLKRLPTRFTSVKTIESMVLKARERTLLKEIDMQSRRYIAMFRSRLMGRPYNKFSHYLDDFQCPTQLAERIRREGWEKEFIVLTKPPIQHQFMIIPMDIAYEEQLKPSVVIKTSVEIQQNPQNATRSFASFKPYVGSVTDQKVTRPAIEFAEKTGHTKAFLTLGYTRTWAALMKLENIYSFLSVLLEEKLANLQIPPEVEDINELFRHVTSGNIGHRFLTEIEKPFAMVNSLPGFTTHFFQSSNNMAVLSEGGRDHNVFYQELYVTNMQVIRTAGCIVGNVDDSYISVRIFVVATLVSNTLQTSILT